jgi:hypothetical protein
VLRNVLAIRPDNSEVIAETLKFLFAYLIARAFWQGSGDVHGLWARSIKPLEGSRLWLRRTRPQVDCGAETAVWGRAETVR